MHQPSGIYIITCVKTGHEYIGQTSNFPRRHAEHWNSLNKGSHPNKRLQAEWNKYGAKSFRFEAVKWCSIKELNKWEEYYIKTYQPYFNDNYWVPYNSRRRRKKY